MFKNSPGISYMQPGLHMVNFLVSYNSLPLPVAAKGNSAARSRCGWKWSSDTQEMSGCLTTGSGSPNSIL